MDWAIILGAIVLGFLLILIEIFLIPGLNIFGLLGMLCILGGIYQAYAEFGGVAALQALFASLVLAFILLQVVSRTRAWRRFILETSEKSESGYRSSSQKLDALLGQTGRAITSLRPAGMAEINGERIDVVTEAAFVDRDTPVQVIAVKGQRVIVEVIDPASGETSEAKTDA